MWPKGSNPPFPESAFSGCVAFSGALLEDDKRATANVQNGFVFFFFCLFILFYSLKKIKDFKRKSWVKKCEKVCRNDFAL